jgi:hypothetical protein
MLKYHVSQPQNQKTTYTSNDNIIFYIPSQDDRVLLNNSVRIAGKIRITGFSDPDDISMPLLDNFTGIHSVISRIDTEGANTGGLENMGDYDRFVGSVNRAGLHYNDLFNSYYASELITPHDIGSALLLAGEVPINQVAEPTDLNKMSFSFRPKFCLNNMSSNLPLATTGDLKVEIVLQNDNRVLQQILKEEVGIEDLTYEISDLVLLYNTLPLQDKQPQNVSMRVHSYFKTIVNSTFVNFQTKANLRACDSFFVTAIPSNLENNQQYNNYKCYQIPNLRKLTIEWNDSVTGSQISYLLPEFDREEVLTNFIQAVTNMLEYDNSLSANAVNVGANNSWGMGLKFNSGAVDLTQNKLSINMESDLLTNTNYTLYFFFSGVLTI